MISIKSDKGDLAYIDRLIETYGDSILRVCFLYLKDFHLAEDAVQDTFLKVYKNYSKFKGKSSEKTWITRIAINVCKNHTRKLWWKKIDVKASLADIPDPNYNTCNDDLIIEIMRLPAKYKEVILLYYYQGFKIREISKVLKIPESTVSIRLKRARGKLKLSLEGIYCYE